MKRQEELSKEETAAIAQEEGPAEPGAGRTSEAAQDEAGPEAVEPDPAATARAEADAFKDRWLRLAAEFENYKKRTAREFEALVQTANENLVRGLLPVLDSVDRALAHREDGADDSEGFQEGMRMIMEQLPRVLRDRGLTEIDALGQPFDPNFHEAMMQMPSAEYGEGQVSHVVEKGYRLGEKVIRPAKVVISQGPPGTDGQTSEGADAEAGSKDP